MVNFSTEYTLQNSPSTVTKNSLVLYRRLLWSWNYHSICLVLHTELYFNISLITINIATHYVWWILKTKYWWGSNYNWDSTICSKIEGISREWCLEFIILSRYQNKGGGFRREGDFWYVMPQWENSLLAISSHCGFLCLVQSDLN